MNIDVHNHFYPKSYLDELSKGGRYARVEKDVHGRLLIHYEGDYNIVVGPHIDIGDRLKAMRARISDEDKEKILWKNAAELLKL